MLSFGPLLASFPRKSVACSAGSGNVRRGSPPQRMNVEHYVRSPSLSSVGEGDDVIEMFLPFAHRSWRTHVWQRGEACFISTFLLHVSPSLPVFSSSSRCAGCRGPCRFCGMGVQCSRLRGMRPSKACCCQRFLQLLLQPLPVVAIADVASRSSKSGHWHVFRVALLFLVFSCFPHAESPLEFFVSVSSSWDVCQQQAAAVSTQAPSKFSAQAEAERDTTHLRIGIVEALRSSRIKAGSFGLSVTSHARDAHPEGSSKGAQMWVPAGCCFLVPSLTLLLEDVALNEILSLVGFLDKCCKGPLTWHEWCLTHRKHSVQLAQLRNAFGEEHPCSCVLSDAPRGHCPSLSHTTHTSKKKKLESVEVGSALLWCAL